MKEIGNGLIDYKYLVEDALEGEVVDVLGEEIEEEEAAKVHLVQIHLHLGVLSDVASHLQKIPKENVDRVARVQLHILG